MVERTHRLPNANRPELLTRVLELIAKGVRSTRGLEEALGLDPRTVNSYTQAGQWLGLLEEPDVLSPLGLEYVFVEGRRSELYARAVWSQPLAAKLLGKGKELPSVEAVTKFVLIVEPDIAMATMERRVSALRALLAPAIGHDDPVLAESGRTQLSLPLAAPEDVEESPKEPESPPREWASLNDPDGYRALLCTLLDQGEIELGRLRALLDQEGAQGLELSGVIGLAVERGDAVQIDGTLVVTSGAIARREVATTTASVMLSDPGYRRYLTEVLALVARAQEGEGVTRAKRHYAAWDQRLLGHPLSPETLAEDLDHVLLGRSLGSFPLAGRSGDELAPSQAPFLEVADREGLVVCLPPDLERLSGGLSAVNQWLEQAHRAGPVWMPGLADRARLVHGGLFHPGEVPRRSVPDLRSLRMRVVAHSPYVAVLCALLLAHRQRPSLMGLVHQTEGWCVVHHGRPVGRLLSLMDEFMVGRGWYPSRRIQRGLSAHGLLEAMAGVGIVALFDGQAVMTERFFVQIRRDVEEQEVGVLLAPLVDALEQFVVQRAVQPPYSEVVGQL